MTLDRVWTSFSPLAGIRGLQPYGEAELTADFLAIVSVP